MIEKEKISSNQLLIFVILFTVGSSILLSPSGFASEAKQDAWLGAIFVTIITPIFMLTYIKLWKLFPDQTLIHLNEKILGKWIGKIVSLLYLFFFFTISSLLLREIGDFMTTSFMPETPIQTIHILFISVVIMGTRLGLETFARSSEIFFPWIILLFIILIVAVSPNVKFQNLQPIFEGGIKPIIRSSILPIGLNVELVVFLMIFPNINQPEKVGKSFLIGSIIGGGMIFIITLYSILAIGAEMTTRHYYPSIVLAKMINVGNFLQRIEVIMAGLWIFTIFFKLIILFYGVNLGLTQLLKLKDYRFLTFPLGIMEVVSSIIFSPNISYFNMYNTKAFPPFAMTLGLILPVLLFGIATIKKRFVSKKG